MPKQVYLCGLCEKIHHTLSSAELCERGHHTVTRVRRYIFDEDNATPFAIECQMDNGERLYFRRDDTLQHSYAFREEQR